MRAHRREERVSMSLLEMSEGCSDVMGPAKRRGWLKEDDGIGHHAAHGSVVQVPEKPVVNT